MQTQHPPHTCGCTLLRRQEEAPERRALGGVEVPPAVDELAGRATQLANQAKVRPVLLWSSL